MRPRTEGAAAVQPVPKKSKMWVVVLATAVLAGVAAQASLPSHHRTARETPAEMEQRQRALRVRLARHDGESAIRSMLKDPSSAVFKDVQVHERSSQIAVCGIVNAKNSFGAMTGDTPWVVVPDQQLALIYSEKVGDIFIAAWDNHCSVPDGPAPK